MRVITKCLLAMKLTIILLTAAFLQVSAKGNAQGITYSAKDVPIAQVFSAIKKQTSYVFFYRNDDLSRAKPVTVDLKNATLEQALELIFRDQPLSYSIKKNTIVISVKPTHTSTQSSGGTIFQEQKRLVDLVGRVLDANGTPLAGAAVVVKNSGKGVKTDEKTEQWAHCCSWRTRSWNAVHLATVRFRRLCVRTLPLECCARESLQ